MLSPLEPMRDPCHGWNMSNKISNIGFAVLAVAGMMASGCARKTPIAKTPTAPVATPPTSASTSGRDGGTVSGSRASTSPAPSTNTGITQSERATLNQSLTNLSDALFDYDKATIRPDATQALQGDVTVIRSILAKYPQQKVKIEGHADERGSDEYNVALGDKRALAAKEFLTAMGIQPTQLDIVSFGKQRPVCTDHNEDCWQRNRRALLVAEGSSSPQ